MPIPDRIERTVELAHPPQRVSEALTSADTRLTVVESGFAQVPEELLDRADRGNVEGWRKELAELAGYLDDAA